MVILAGGLGLRLHEETERIPKPMIRIGEMPILWHVMRHYNTHGFRRFIICLGYKSWVVKEYFLNYAEEVSDLQIDMATGGVKLMREEPLVDWEVTLVETGLSSGSTGRLLGAMRYIDTPYFMYTYGDGVGDVDVTALHELHRSTDNLITVTGVRPASRYGILRNDGVQVVDFTEKPPMGEGFVSGGFFCLDTDVLDRFDATQAHGFFEEQILADLVDEGRVGIHRHHGFWHAMDTYRDFVHLNDVWASGDAEWKTW